MCWGYLRNRETATPIDPVCKICEYQECPKRTFPMVGHPLPVSPTNARIAPHFGGRRLLSD